MTELDDRIEKLLIEEETAREFVRMEIEETLAIASFKRLKSMPCYRNTVHALVAVKG